MVLISGEPGIGKSRIAQTIVERFGGAPHHWTRRSDNWNTTKLIWRFKK